MWNVKKTEATEEQFIDSFRQAAERRKREQFALLAKLTAALAKMEDPPAESQPEQ